MPCLPTVRTAAPALLALALLASAATLRADAPSAVLHEFIPPDGREDLELSATTPDGRLPAAIETRSGVVTAPDTTRMPTATERAYGGFATSQSPDRAYHPDRDTRRPGTARYDDPFSPATTPYKRLRAFDAVAPDFSLRVSDATLRPVPSGGAVLPGDDAFYGDITVDLSPGEGVLIPTVGPGARLVRSSVVPPVALEILRDSADNWYARAMLRTRVRLVEQIAIPREAFGGPLRNTARALLPVAPALPPNVQKPAGEVARSLGLQHAGALRELVEPMVDYFRAFEPSDDPPRGRENIYLDLALSKKGVCRHRAYAFVVTALGLGVPSRMVVNEAHAWVEVFDGSLWRRVDLGGAASHIETDAGDPRPAHRPLPDPFAWPSGTDSGEDAARRSGAVRDSSTPAAPGSARPAGAPGAQGAVSSSPAGGVGTGPSTSRSPLPASTLVIVASDAQALRGAPLKLEGTVSADAARCAHVRVDVLLLDPRLGREVSIGSLSTDDEGRFRGAVVVPLEVSVGDYELSVSTPGDSTCGAGRSGP